MRYCPSWIAYECLRILSQTCFQRRPIGAHDALGRELEGQVPENCRERRRRRPGGVGPGQRRRGRPGGERARERRADGLARLGAAGASRPAFTNAAMGRLWRGYSFQGSRVGVAIVRTSHRASRAKSIVARRSRNRHGEHLYSNRESTRAEGDSSACLSHVMQAPNRRLGWHVYLFVRALGALFRQQ